jgi:beta-mannosidase
MKTLPEGPRPDQYKWTFVVNGRPTFLKGCNWATLDAFLRLDKSRYSRFLTMAKDEHIQIMRSWGGGLLETDTFFDLCDELGIMVMQEFPLTWQNFDALRPAVSDEIATLNVIRLRNHPSLAMWCGGNEHSGEGALIELLGRRCLELDGTRPFHRTDPYGGSVHNYDVYWGRQPFEANIKFVPFQNGPAVIGETGLASACAVESTLRILPEAERGVWPPPDGGTFVHHTPTFTSVNMEYLNRHAKELDECKDLAGFTRGTQLAQALGLRIVLERMRANWPNSTAMIFYKLTDVFPGCSWSTVDYFGVPKIAHYFVKQSYAPLHVATFYDSFDVTPGKTFEPQIMVMDDLESVEGPVDISVRLLDAALQPVANAKLSPALKRGRVHDLGKVSLAVPAGAKAPFMLVAELRANNELRDRTFQWFNFRDTPGCLYKLAPATLEARKVDAGMEIRNTGAVPAVAVSFDAPDASDSLRYDDAYFWLEPGETRKVSVSLEPDIEGKTHTPKAIQVSAWNAGAVRVNW